MLNKQIALKAYIECALWSSTDDSGKPLDSSYSEADLADETLKQMSEEIDDFMVANAPKLLASGMTSAQVGHDFWLTRNGHGAGFWDRGLRQLGNDIASAAKVYGGRNLYIGDNSKVCQQ